MKDLPQVTFQEIDIDEIPAHIWHRGMAGFYRKHLARLQPGKAMIVEFASEEEYKVQRYSVIHAAKSMYGHGRVHTRRLPGTNQLFVWMRGQPDREFVPNLKIPFQVNPEDWAKLSDRDKDEVIAFARMKHDRYEREGAI